MVAEFVGSFVFYSVILSLKYDRHTTDHMAASRAIGITLTTMILVTGGISGGGLNPAIGFVQSFF